METPRHFLDLDRFDGATLRAMLDTAIGLKRDGRPEHAGRMLAGRTLAMIFEKPSTRTRISFEVGMKQLGGDVVILSDSESQLGRGDELAVRMGKGLNLLARWSAR